MLTSSKSPGGIDLMSMVFISISCHGFMKAELAFRIKIYHHRWPAMIRVFRFMAFLTAHFDTASALTDEQPLAGGDVADQRSLCFQRLSCRHVLRLGFATAALSRHQPPSFIRGSVKMRPKARH
jgi:hypothetical protein